MIGDVILWATIALPLVLGVSFRVSTNHVFFSLMAGELLGRYFGHDLDKVTGIIGIHGYGEVVLIVLPMVITAYLLRHTISKRRILIGVIPLIVMGFIAAAFILPVLPEHLRDLVSEVWLGSMIVNLNRAIVGGMVAIQLITLWVMHRKGGLREHHTA